jgi:hypothetical protein
MHGHHLLQVAQFAGEGALDLWDSEEDVSVSNGVYFVAVPQEMSFN